jgi:hypothetical protein
VAATTGTSQDDLQFVRQVLQRTESTSPSTLHFLWALITFTGGLVADLRPELAGRFWLVAAPLGFVASAALAYRWQTQVGQLNSEAGRRELLHWTAMLGGLALAVLLVWSNRLTPRGLGSVALLLVALTYIQAAIHFRRRLVWVGLSAAAAYLLTLFAEPYEWTLAGGLVALALIGQVLGKRTNGARREARTV